MNLPLYACRCGGSLVLRAREIAWCCCGAEIDGIGGVRLRCELPADHARYDMPHRDDTATWMMSLPDRMTPPTEDDDK